MTDEQQPVAWRFRPSAAATAPFPQPDHWSYGATPIEGASPGYYEIEPLYAAPPPAPSDAVIEALREALEPVMLSVASVEGVYGFDDDKPVDTRHFGEPYNHFTGLTWKDLRRVVAALAAAKEPAQAKGGGE